MHVTAKVSGCKMVAMDTSAACLVFIIIYVKKTYEFKVNVKDDIYDACKAAIMKISGRKNLDKRALTC
jgi:hypothetical protein